MESLKGYKKAYKNLRTGCIKKLLKKEAKPKKKKKWPQVTEETWTASIENRNYKKRFGDTFFNVYETINVSEVLQNKRFIARLNFLVE